MALDARRGAIAALAPAILAALLLGACGGAGDDAPSAEPDGDQLEAAEVRIDGEQYDATVDCLLTDDPSVRFTATASSTSSDDRAQMSLTTHPADPGGLRVTLVDRARVVADLEPTTSLSGSAAGLSWSVDGDRIELGGPVPLDDGGTAELEVRATCERI